MNKLRTVLLISVLVLPMFALIEFISVKPVQALEAGVHKVTVNYYQAYIHNDHDWDPPWPLPNNKGDWYFRLQAPLGSSWISSGEHKVDGARMCNIYPDLIKSWYVYGNTGFQYRLNARERDSSWDYSVYWTHEEPWPWRSQVFWEKRTGDVTHYWTQSIENHRPVYSSAVEGPSSGVTGVNYEFSITGYDADFDEIGYTWWVRKVTYPYGTDYPSETGNVLTWSFSTAGTYDVYVQATDALGANAIGTPARRITISTAPPDITITRVWTDKKIYTVGENIVIRAKIEEGGVPKTSGTVYARVYPRSSGLIGVDPQVLSMTLVNAARGIWKGTYGPIPWPANPLGYEGEHTIMVVVSAAPSLVQKSTTCFVALRLTQSSVAKFLRGWSPSRVGVGTNFEVKARIKNPSGSSQTLKVKLILPSGMTKVTGALIRTVTLAPGQAKYFKWTLKSTTATNKLVKINVIKGGTVRAKLHWVIRAHVP